MKRLYGHRALFFMTSRPPFSSFFQHPWINQAPCSATFFHTAVSARFLRAPPKLTLTADVANFYARFFLTSYFITWFQRRFEGGRGLAGSKFRPVNTRWKPCWKAVYNPSHNSLRPSNAALKSYPTRFHGFPPGFSNAASRFSHTPFLVPISFQHHVNK